MADLCSSSCKEDHFSFLHGNNVQFFALNNPRSECAEGLWMSGWRVVRQAHYERLSEQY